MNKDMYILIGAPGVGKSTWIEKEFQGECCVISTDNILQAIADEEGKTYNDVFQKYISVADKMMWKEFDSIVSGRCYPIVIDRTNMSRKVRAKFFDRLRLWHRNQAFKVHAVIFNKPDDVEYERRLNSRPGKTIPKLVIENMLRSYEEPSLDEGFDSIIYADNR